MAIKDNAVARAVRLNEIGIAWFRRTARGQGRRDDAAFSAQVDIKECRRLQPI
jgi:hypothetical protein